MEFIFGSESMTMPFVGLLLGLVFCFMGRKVLGFIIVLLGFAIGWQWGAAPLADLFNTGASWVPWVAGALGGIISVVAWKLSMFLAGTVIGLFLVRGIFPELARLAQVGIALAVGALVQVFKKPIISLFTAFAGAYMVGSSLAVLSVSLGLIGTVDLVAENAGNIPGYIRIGTTVILTIVGYLFQTRKLSD